jgi:predicted dehydrogenase
MKFLIIGMGSIGRRHLSNLSSLYPKSTIFVYDINSTQAKNIIKKTSFQLLNSKDLWNISYDCVFVCTPPSTHVDWAIRSLTEGNHVFIEKPISSNSKGLSKLQKLSKTKKKFVFVGYNFRFNESVKLIKNIVTKKKFGNVIHISSYYGNYLPDWRPWQNYRESYTAKKKLGGGIILDASHELDYLIWIFGNPLTINSEYQKVKFLDTDTEAVADIQLKFPNNVLANIHVNYVRRTKKRVMEIMCEQGIIQWLPMESKLLTFSAKTNKWNTQKIESESSNVMYVDEIKHVINCITKKSHSQIIDLSDGIIAMEISQLALKSGKLGKRIEIKKALKHKCK